MKNSRNSEVVKRVGRFLVKQDAGGNAQRGLSVFILSIVLLIFGCFLFNEQLEYSIIRFINDSLALHLNEKFRVASLEYCSTMIIYAGLISALYFLFLNNKIKYKQLIITSVLLLIFHYTYYVLKNAVNYPSYDDEPAILNFLSQYPSEGSLQVKITYLFTSLNDSWIILPRLFFLAIFKLTHQINFKYLIWFNISGAVLILLFVQKLFLNKKENFKFVIVVGLLLFQFEYFHTIFLGLGMCYYWIIIFSCASFHFLVKEKKGNVLSLFFAICACLTYGNGFIIFPLAIFYLFRKKRKTELIIWLITMCGCIALYIYYNPIHEQGRILNYNPLLWLVFCLGFWGSICQFFYSMYLPFLIGFGVLCIFITGIYKKWYIKSELLFLVLTFFILSTLAAAPFRISDTDIGMLIPGRYGLFSVCIIILSSILLVRNSTVRINFKICVLIAFVFNLLTGIFFYPEIALRKEELTDLKNLASHEILLNSNSNRSTNFNIQMEDAIKKEIYKPEN